MHVTYKDSEQKTSEVVFLHVAYFKLPAMFSTSKSYSYASSGPPQTRPCMSLVIHVSNTYYVNYFSCEIVNYECIVDLLPIVTILWHIH